MLALFNTLTEEDKDFIISMSDSLVREYGIFLKVKMHKTGGKNGQFINNGFNSSTGEHCT